MMTSVDTWTTRGAALLLAVLAVGALHRDARRLDHTVRPVEAVEAPYAAVREPGAVRPPESRPEQVRLARIEWAPERPEQGTAFTLVAEPTDAPIDRIEARAAGEELHFRRMEDGRFEALAAVPVDATGELELRVDVWTTAGRRDRRTLAVPVAEGDYAMEQLSVAPRYGGDRPAELQRRITREYERAMRVGRNAHGTPRMWDRFVRPRPSRVTSGFGNGRIFNGEVQSRHTGTDFAGDIGAPVRAAARGIVTIVDAFYLGGNVVYVDHGGGLSTAYLHLSDATVTEGDTVQAGEVIGSVGASGRVTGPHLHWIVRYGDISIDGLSLPGLER